jgi:hypothetical protein
MTTIATRMFLRRTQPSLRGLRSVARIPAAWTRDRM